MTDDPTPPENEQRRQTRSREETLVWSAIWVCLILAVIAFFLGVSMASASRVAPCENGHGFPEGTTDFNCYVHPQGGVGTAIAVFSLLLGTLIVFSGITAVAAVRARSHDKSRFLDLK